MTTTIIKYEIGSWGKQIKDISDRRNSMHFITPRSAICLKYSIYKRKWQEEKDKSEDIDKVFKDLFSIPKRLDFIL